MHDACRPHQPPVNAYREEPTLSRGNTNQSELRIDSSSKEVKLVDTQLTGVFGAVPDLAPIYDPVRLSVAEALNNCIEHAYGNESGHSIDVKFEADPDSIRIVICDEGAQAPEGMWDNVALPEFDVADTYTLPEGGFGLYIIKSQMDEVHYGSSDGVNTLILVKRLSTET